MNIIWSKIVEILEGIIITLTLVLNSSIPAGTPIPTSLDLQITADSGDPALIEVITTATVVTPTPKPTPNIAKQIIELKEIIASYTPEPQPSPIIIYVNLPTPLPTPIPVVIPATPEPIVGVTTPTPIPTPTPVPSKIICESPGGGVKCYSTFSDTKIIKKIVFWQLNDYRIDLEVTIRRISGEVVFQEIIKNGVKHEIALNIPIPPIQNYDIFTYDMAGMPGMIQVRDVVWE